MRFYYIGSLLTFMNSFRGHYKFNNVERKDVKIAIIDDESFPLKETLLQHKFNIDVFHDVTSIDQFAGYEIILCDIQGVGKQFSQKYQGAYIVNEIYKRFPFKVLMSYTSKSTDITFNKYLHYAEFSIKKDADSEEWVEKLDTAIKLVSDPENRWIRTRNYLLEKGVSLFELALLEDEYVRHIIENKPFDDFPPKKLRGKITDEIETILKDFTNIIKLVNTVVKDE